jgi:dTDP-4-dehydrorhamnose reductase
MPLGMSADQAALFGASSMIGWSILRASDNPTVIGFCNASTRPHPAGVERGIDLDDERAVASLFAELQPALIIHCAAVCNVEACERSPEFAHAVNVEGTRLLLAYAPATARIVYVSSDHVFGGDAGPYDERSPTAPISIYGHTRVAAEQLVLARPGSLVIRTSLWIGPSANGRVGHLDWLRDRHRRNLPMTVYSDEIRSAVWADAGGRRVWELARSPLTGVRHITATRAVARPALAAYVDRHHAIGARFDVAPRATRPVPHIGNVELATCFRDALAAPLPSAVPESA